MASSLIKQGNTEAQILLSPSSRKDVGLDLFFPKELIESMKVSTAALETFSFATESPD